MGAGEIRAGRAYVEIAAKDNTSPGIKSAEAQFRQLGNSVRTIGMSMMAAGAGIMTPLIMAARTFMDMGHSVEEMSQRTGIGAETLSALGYAAKHSGIDMEFLGGGLKKMAVLIYEAEKGTGTAVKTLSALGISVKDIAAQSPEAQFKSIAEAISKVEDPTKRAALAVDIFGRNGTELLPLLLRGAGGIDEMTRRARELGVVLTESDVKAAGEFKDTFEDTVAVVKMAAFQIGSSLAPALKRAMQLMMDGAKWVRDFAREHKTAAQAALLLGGALVGIGAALVVLGSVSKAILAINSVLTMATGQAVLFNSTLAATPAIAASAGTALAAVHASAGNYSDVGGYMAAAARARKSDAAAAGVSAAKGATVGTLAVTASKVILAAAVLYMSYEVGKWADEKTGFSDAVGGIGWQKEWKPGQPLPQEQGKMVGPGQYEKINPNWAISTGPHYNPAAGRTPEEQYAAEQRAELERENAFIKHEEELDRLAAISKDKSDEELQQQHKLNELKIAGMEEGLDKEKAAINEKYDYEDLMARRKLAEGLATDEEVATIAKEREQELANAAAAWKKKTDKEASEEERKAAEAQSDLLNQQDEEQRAKNEKTFEEYNRKLKAARQEDRSTLEQIEDMTIEKELKGVALRHAQLELDRRRALDRAKGTGQDEDLINQMYDMKEQLLQGESTSSTVSRGISNISQLRSLDVGGKGDRLAETAEKSLAQQERATKALEKLRDMAVESGLVFTE